MNTIDNIQTPEEFRAALREVVIAYVTGGIHWPANVGKQEHISRLGVAFKEIQELADDLPAIIVEAQAE